jgi:hypothetical protein
VIESAHQTTNSSISRNINITISKSNPISKLFAFHRHRHRQQPHITMKSCGIVLLIAFEFGVAQSFNSPLRSCCCFRPSAAPSRSLPNRKSSPSQRRPITSLLLSFPSDTDLSSTAPSAIQKRRAFLSNFAAVSLLPIITSVNPASVSAWGFPNNEKGPLVYGADDIMSPKEHGTTSMPVQENLRYGVSIL